MLNAAAGLAAHAGLSDDLDADLSAGDGGAGRARFRCRGGLKHRWIALGRELTDASP